MSTFISNSTVTRQEAEALKEMIFNRVRARVESMNNDTGEAYTTNIQYDVMDLARSAFASNKNPFVQIMQSQENQSELSKKENEICVEEDNLAEANVTKPNYKGLGFQAGQRQRSEINNAAIKNTIEQTMAEARKNSENSKHFVGALDFLNSQASISLAKNKAHNFDKLA